MASNVNIPPHVGSCLKRALSLHDRGDAAGAVADIQQHQKALPIGLQRDLQGV